MKKLLLIFSVIYCGATTFAQTESWNWNFGVNAGISFSSGSPVAFTTSALNTIEGSASISDNSGNLLFYTDGVTVYNSQNSIMTNGTGLMGHFSATESAMIVKQPGSNTLYYIFTMDYNHDGLAIGNGFRYSIVDMSLSAGLGAVTIKNVLIRLPVYEKMVAIRHGNNSDFWIVINDWGNDDIFSYLLTASGLDTIPVMSNAGPFHQMDMGNTAGYMKASSQGDELALALWQTKSFVFLKYNNLSGIASTPINVQSNDMDWTYGAEFSSDGTKFYGTKLNPPGSLYQFDLSAWSATTVLNSRVLLGSNPSQYYYCALQIGPDGKIYCAVNNSTYLGVINYPDLAGTACNYVNNGVSLSGKTCKYGLPVFTHEYSKSASVNELKHDDVIEMYPAPVSDELFISIKGQIADGSCRILDITGKQLAFFRITDSNFKINISQLENGIYFLQLTNGDRIVNRKFIVQK